MFLDSLYTGRIYFTDVEFAHLYLVDLSGDEENRNTCKKYTIGFPKQVSNVFGLYLTSHQSEFAPRSVATYPSLKIVDPLGISHFEAPQTPSDESSPAKQVLPVGKADWAVITITPTRREHQDDPPRTHTHSGKPRSSAKVNYEFRFILLALKSIFNFYFLIVTDLP